MERSKLTDRTVQRAPVPESGERIIWDADVQGLGLRLRSSGSRTWLLKRGSRRWSLGHAGERSVLAVRGEALAILAELAAGREPDRKPRTGRPKVADLLEAYLSEHVAKRRTDTTLTDYRRTADRHILPRLGNKLVDEVMPIQVDRLLTDMRATPAAANKSTALLKASMQWGMRAGYRAPALGNPCMGAELYKLEERGKTLEARELVLVLSAMEWIGRRPNRWHAAACLRLLALTGCRRDEVRALRWSWIDRERRRIDWPRTKTGRGHLVLHGAALAILEAVEQRDADMPTEHVFRGLNPDLVLPRATLYRTWSEVKKAAVEGGVDADRILPLRPHDLRHSFATLGLSHGLSLEDVGRLLRHRDTRTTKRYAKHLASRELALADQSLTFLLIGQGTVDPYSL